MTALERIREEQEKLAERAESLRGDAWHHGHREWLKLQREVLAISRGERCEEHSFENCGICKPHGPLRPERG